MLHSVQISIQLIILQVFADMCHHERKLTITKMNQCILHSHTFKKIFFSFGMIFFCLWLAINRMKWLKILQITRKWCDAYHSLCSHTTFNDVCLIVCLLVEDVLRMMMMMTTTTTMRNVNVNVCFMERINKIRAQVFSIVKHSHSSYGR